MSVICPFCKALKCVGEYPVAYAAQTEMVRLPDLQNTRQLLLSLLLGQHLDLQQFMEKIDAYNTAFQMTSFGHKPIHEDSYMSTFKIQTQIYHWIGSILPVNNAEY
ncbi:Hypothetical predicted protein [Octopus vulgaris]|uniref:Uncharacterized protein n=1 Tax=Octopus vulgaris TaxID=6645 RepID=A0AA36B7V3_OCTVU|nr:Hypothetical predicted protein [Octopus vulgaris]